MYKYLSNIVIYAQVIFFYGCVTPSPIYTIQPAEDEIKWESGVGMIEKSDAGISILIGFNENKDDMMCFDVIVKNESDSVIIIDPALFECIPYNNIGKDTTHYPINGISFHAINPEHQIHQNEIFISKEDASFKSYQTSAAFGSLLGLASDIILISKTKTDEEQHIRDHEREKTNEQYSQREREHQQKMQDLHQTKFFWQNTALRKTTLAQGQSISGKVLYYHQPEVKYFLLRFPIASSFVKIWFKQKVSRIS